MFATVFASHIKLVSLHFRTRMLWKICRRRDKVKGSLRVNTKHEKRYREAVSQKYMRNTGQVFL